MKVIFEGEHFGLTKGKIYEVIPYANEKIRHTMCGYARLQNDFGQVFDYWLEKFLVVNPTYSQIIYKKLPNFDN